MLEIFFIITVSVISCLLIRLYLIKREFFENVLLLTDSQKRQTAVLANYKDKMFFLLLLSIVLIISFYLRTNVLNSINFIKLFLLNGIILTASIVDWKDKIIPNKLILLALLLRIICYFVEFILYRDTIPAIFFNDLCGFILGFVLLAILYMVSKGGIGAGDVKLFGIIGIFGGFYCTYSTLFLSMVFAALLSFFLLVSKKKGRKDTIAFGPCIYLAYFTTIILSNY